MIFPKWTNSLPLVLLLGAGLAAGAVAAGVTIYLTPKYTRAGYQPVQPVPFSHKIHAGQLGVDGVSHGAIRGVDYLQHLERRKLVDAGRIRIARLC